MCKRKWRIEGRKHNLLASKEAGHKVRHQGRLNKQSFILPKGSGMSNLLQNLFKKIGITSNA